eukprot:scaffold8963_cov185-Skeletonema_marinoi.AAC.2
MSILQISTAGSPLRASSSLRRVSHYFLTVPNCNGNELVCVCGWLRANPQSSSRPRSASFAADDCFAPP